MLKIALMQSSCFNVARQMGWNRIGSGMWLLSTANKQSFNIMPCRTTFILRRRIPVKQLRKSIDPEYYVPKKNRNRLYDIEEVTDLTKEPEIEIILKTTVSGIGEAGDIVKVKRSVAYSDYLLPQLANYGTPEALKIARADVERGTTKEEKEERHSSPFVLRTVEVLKSRIIGVVMNKETSWVLEKWHVKASLRKAGIHMTEECIQLPDQPIQGPDMNLEGKEFLVTITINNTESVKVRCRIHHWSTEISNRLPPVPHHWTLPAEPLFQTEADQLAAMPLPSLPTKSSSSSSLP